MLFIALFKLYIILTLHTKEHSCVKISFC